jgi:hypothetical protein
MAFQGKIEEYSSEGFTITCRERNKEIVTNTIENALTRRNVGYRRVEWGK